MAQANKKNPTKPVPLKPKGADNRLSQDEKILGKTLKHETHLTDEELDAIIAFLESLK